MKVGIMCKSYGQRCGISTYSERLNRALNKAGVKSHIFINEPHEDVDIISVQYEPGILHPIVLGNFLTRHKNQKVVVTAHHTRGLGQLFGVIDGIVLHDESQILPTEVPPKNKYRVIPHPALVFPRLDKKEVKKELGLPTDKIIIGTAGFICGTGKRLPVILSHLLELLEDDMFLYFITSFWKGGDMGRYKQISNLVKMYGKENQFRIDIDFKTEEELNKSMQACDLLFAWNITGPNDKGSQSGIASDMYGSYTKLIVKDSPHYSFIKKQKGVLVGPTDPRAFAEAVIKAAKSENLHDVPDPTWLSWDNQVKKYIEYFEEVIG